MRLRHAGGLAVALLLAVPLKAGAEWHFKPFLGLSFEPSTTLIGDIELAAGLPVDPEMESQSSNVDFGAAVALLGEVFGVEGGLVPRARILPGARPGAGSQQQRSDVDRQFDHGIAAPHVAVHVTAVFRRRRRHHASAEARTGAASGLFRFTRRLWPSTSAEAQRVLQRADRRRLGRAVLPISGRRGDRGSAGHH